MLGVAVAVSVGELGSAGGDQARQRRTKVGVDLGCADPFEILQRPDDACGSGIKTWMAVGQSVFERV